MNYLPPDSHPASVIYFLSAFKVKFSYPDGKTTEAEGKPGQVIWTEPVTHAAENVGTTEAHVIVVELKEQKKMEEPKK